MGFALMLAVSPVSAQTATTLDGAWEGSLAFINPPAGGGTATKTYSVAFRIVLSGTTARVFTQGASGEPFQEAKPGSFRAGQLGPNGVIVSIDSGRDDEGTWYETWDFAITLKDDKTLLATFYRIVNNVDLPLSIAHSKFSSMAIGELTRTK